MLIRLYANGYLQKTKASKVVSHRANWWTWLQGKVCLMINTSIKGVRLSDEDFCLMRIELIGAQLYLFDSALCSSH